MQEFKKQAIEAVRDWNTLFGLKPSADIGLRMAIVGEELLETIRAKDETELMDGLVDSCWTLVGTMLDFSMPVTEMMTADDLVDDVHGMSTSQIVASISGLHCAGMACFHCVDGKSALATATDLAFLELTSEFGLVSAELAFAEVNRSNLAKLWGASQIIHLPNDWTAARADAGNLPSDETLYIVKNEHGKVRKPPGWCGPDFTATLAAAAIFRSSKGTAKC